MKNAPRLFVDQYGTARRAATVREFAPVEVPA